MEIITQVAVEYLINIVTLIVISALGILGSWILGKINVHKNLSNIGIATEQLIAATQETVLELQQTLVDDWKASQEGRLTADQVVELKERVLNITLDKLATPVCDLLESAQMDIEKMIRSAAESYIAELKK